MAKGAYGDGLNFLKSAAKLAEKDVELEVVLEVIDRAIEDIKEQNGQVSYLFFVVGYHVSVY